MKLSVFRFYWETGEGKKAVDMTVNVIAPTMTAAINSFVTSYPHYAQENIKNIEVLPGEVLIA
jgi:hypothetical protein